MATNPDVLLYVVMNLLPVTPSTLQRVTYLPASRSRPYAKERNDRRVLHIVLAATVSPQQSQRHCA